MPMIATELNISCIWGGTLPGILLKNDLAGKDTVKIIAIHGWLDNLNSLLPVAKKLVDRHPNYEIYLYDRAGHGFSSHLPKGFDYSATLNQQDLRTVVQTLGWDKEKFSIIGHSYGAMLGMTYAASYTDEVVCVVAIDALPRNETARRKFFSLYGARVDLSIQLHKQPSRTFDTDLTLEKVLAVTKETRPGITDEAAKCLAERSIRQDSDNKIHFTRDEAVKLLTPIPFVDFMVENAVQSIKAPVLFIGAIHPQWPRPQDTIDLLKKHQPNFEMTFIDGPHHLHMTHVNEVLDKIEQFFNKYL